jgi:nitrile hydratase subunit beta
MGRINDVGGMQGFGEVLAKRTDSTEPSAMSQMGQMDQMGQGSDEPAFHADWEAHVFALNRALLGRGVYNLDEFRDAIERMPAQEYLASSYYEKWFHAITALLADKGVLTEQEMSGG